MSTEINKNKKWTNRADIKKRSKKVINETSKNDIIYYSIICERIDTKTFIINLNVIRIICYKNLKKL